MTVANYDVVLLDLDDTLLDFHRAEEAAFTQTCKDYGIPTDEAVYGRYKEINSGYWQKLERGEVSKADLVIFRYRDFLAEYRSEANPVDFNRDYLDNLGAIPLPGSEELCATLAPHCRLLVATNGVGRTARRRVASSPFASYIDGIIISEEAGIEKPSPDFFRYGFETYGVPRDSRVLMVGDSLFADIGGGKNAGLATCWYNPGNKPLTGEVRPDFQVSHLLDVIQIVLS